MNNLINPYRYATLGGPPVVQTRSQGANSALNVTSHPVTLPSGIVAGDLLLVIFSSDGGPTITVETVASGSNWSAVSSIGNDGTPNVTGAWLWKIAEGSDVLVLTTSVTERSSYIVFRISNATGVTGTSSGGASTDSDPPTHTPVAGSDEYLWIATRSGDSTVEATAAPVNYINFTSQNANDLGGASTSTAERTLTASSENPGTFTSVTEQWVCWTLAVAP